VDNNTLSIINII